MNQEQTCGERRCSSSSFILAHGASRTLNTRSRTNSTHCSHVVMTSSYWLGPSLCPHVMMKRPFSSVMLSASIPFALGRVKKCCVLPPMVWCINPIRLSRAAADSMSSSWVSFSIMLSSSVPNGLFVCESMFVFSRPFILGIEKKTSGCL